MLSYQITVLEGLLEGEPDKWGGNTDDCADRMADAACSLYHPHTKEEAAKLLGQMLIDIVTIGNNENINLSEAMRLAIAEHKKAIEDES